ncbi:3'(2'),5'-bisphosphate nucleotidase 1 [Dendroctonus ponderosae]|uniref:3'(2'),5'-bisphosphate nucleotidase 1 n=1 Tax=Dendroctonus ponderosae TaxID=77166 RepID=A0AAR5P5S4_DENPD|nr:3'(2'),5'-bisphosphate nucleotidase 1 [Dendroctonus ponderosae]XP_019756460.1 3'(2'),5'-bisphosphate nucleotidase 1 [Dendroctonus ponderosae]XP_048523133.1 3'(2'),5'-bisphosphate nucleotidase 1 [Dendroctonus ponderosae]
MAQNSPLILRILASSAMVVSRAGQIIRDVKTNGELGIIDKGSYKNDLQTEADRSAQKCIVGTLSKLFPGVTIIGEEGPHNESEEISADWIVTDLDDGVLASTCPSEFATLKPEDIVVWVDPLDGTLEYTQGFLDSVTVLIGLAVNGKAVGGVIHQPYYNFKEEKDCKGRTLWGLVGLGVGGFVPNSPPVDKFIITTTRSHSDDTVVKAVEALKPDEVIKMGGAGRKTIMLLEGHAHAYVHASKGCKKWDTCAPEGVLRALGGILTDIHGKAYDYSKDASYPNNQGSFATSRYVNHQELIDKIPQELKDRFPY